MKRNGPKDPNPKSEISDWTDARPITDFGFKMQEGSFLQVLRVAVLELFDHVPHNIGSFPRMKFFVHPP